MNGNHIINVAFGALLMTMLLAGPNEVQARDSSRNTRRGMQAQLAKQQQAEEAEAAQRAAAITAEHRRLFEIHQKASKARNEKIEAEREAARERRLAEQRTKDATPARDTKPKS